MASPFETKVMRARFKVNQMTYVHKLSGRYRTCMFVGIMYASTCNNSRVDCRLCVYIFTSESNNIFTVRLGSKPEGRSNTPPLTQQVHSGVAIRVSTLIYYMSDHVKQISVYIKISTGCLNDGRLRLASLSPNQNLLYVSSQEHPDRYGCGN